MSRIEQLKSFLKEDPKDSFLLFAMAKEYEALEKDRVALEFYLQIKEFEPTYIGLYYHLGKLYERMSDNAAAVETYQTGISLAKETKDFHAASELNGALELIS